MEWMKEKHYTVEMSAHLQTMVECIAFLWSVPPVEARKKAVEIMEGKNA